MYSWVVAGLMSLALAELLIVSNRSRSPSCQVWWLVSYFCTVTTVNPNSELLTGRTKSTSIGKLKSSWVTTEPPWLETVVTDDTLFFTDVFWSSTEEVHDVEVDRFACFQNPDAAR